jgi:arginine deiminase
LQVAANESGLLRETLKERDAEIAYLQQQLEEAVAELQLARNVMSSQKPSADVVPRYTTKQRQQAQSQSAANGPNNTPMKMVQDMKDRLKVNILWPLID